MKTIITLHIDRSSFVSLLKERVDSHANFYYPRSSKDLIGTVEHDHFEVMLANTFGTKPVINGEINDTDKGITVLLTPKLQTSTRVVFIIMSIVSVLLSILAITQGAGVLPIVGVILLLGFAIAIIVISFRTETSRVNDILVALVGSVKQV